MKYKKRGMGRPKGTTKCRKPILKSTFIALLETVESSDMLHDKKMMMLSAFMLLRYGGFRVSELVGLRVSDLRDMRNEHTMHLGNDTKTRKGREVYFDAEQAERIFSLLSRIVDVNDPKAVLFRGRGGKYDKRNVTSFTRILNETLHLLLGPQYSTHSFRAGHITDMHYAGISMKVVQQHIGHTSLMTTMRYVNVKEQAKRDAISVL